MELKLNNIKKSFGKKEVLKGINYNFESGKIYGLLGKNGSGKTTLFNCISKDLKVDDGEAILVKENESHNVDTSDIGYVLSTPTVPSFLTGREFIEFFCEINNIVQELNVDQYLESIGIEGKDRDKLLRDYSHGMKSKVQMLVNMLAKPNILLLDEPLISLDVVAAEEMKILLRTMKADRITIFSTHIMDLAIDLCDSIVLLHNGIIEEVNKEDLSSEEFKSKIINALKEDYHAEEFID